MALPDGSRIVSGTEALVEMLLAQAAFDRQRGLKTGGFVSGYRGSPLGGLDQMLWRRSEQLTAAGIRFQPAINEDLAATALIGTQKVETSAAAAVQGVFGLWYGKGPGVDRSGDALKHGNAYGASPHGGVLVVAGDDHGCVSSSMSHQSDLAMQAWSMPVLHPLSVADYVPAGLWGWEASRTSGAWIGFKAISEIVESSATIVPQPLPAFTAPAVDPGPDGLHWRWPDLPGPQVELRLHYKLEALRTFAQANPIDIPAVPVPHPRALIIAVGKAYLDTLEALRAAGLTPDDLARSGIALLPLRLVFPLSPATLSLAAQVGHILVIEEKAAVVETQLQRALYNLPGDSRPAITGKRDLAGAPLLPEDIELRPERLASPLAGWLARFDVGMDVPARWVAPPPAGAGGVVPRRTPYFCPGCPHSTSTHVPAGSRAQPGIGCHVMAAWMDRDTAGSVQMGGEGVDWVGTAPFTHEQHIFQNLGDGTYFHSGHLAIRQAIAAGVNITYKILYNDAVAMTGGQPIDGTMTVAQIAGVSLAEGVARVAVVAEDMSRYRDRSLLPAGVSVDHRDHLDSVQRSLRDVKGVTVLIYDQVCATELRRRRKRDRGLPPAPRAVINDLVCEGCGDCQVQSNCLAIVPIETPFGRKRAVDQSNCNTDLSCIKGFCPSFVTVEGATPAQRPVPRARAVDLDALAETLPPPPPAILSGASEPVEILLAGIGGTGVVTAANILARAARHDGHEVRILNFTGFAQKGGEVVSHVRFCRNGAALHQVRIARGQAHLLLAADLVVSAGAKVLDVLSPDRTHVIANLHESQTGPMLRDPDLRLGSGRLIARLKAGSRQYDAADADRLAQALVGDRGQANMVLLGLAFQHGALPLTRASIERAFESVGKHAPSAGAAFRWGRIAAAFPEIVEDLIHEGAGSSDQDLPALVAQRQAYLTDYQDAAYARRYIDRVDRIKRAADAIGDTSLTEAVALQLFRLMAYKDEYEVARLHVRTGFLAALAEDFGGKPRLRFHFSPPLVAPRDARTGERGKLSFGPWIIPVLRLLARGKRLRGTWLDLFGLQAERRAERALLAEYERHVDWIAAILTPDRLAPCRSLAELPAQIRGYGHVKRRNAERVAPRRAALVREIGEAGLARVAGDQMEAETPVDLPPRPYDRAAAAAGPDAT